MECLTTGKGEGYGEVDAALTGCLGELSSAPSVNVRAFS